MFTPGIKVRFTVPRYDFELEGTVISESENCLRIGTTMNVYEVPNEQVPSCVRFMKQEEKDYQEQQKQIAARYTTHGGNAAMSNDPHYDPATGTYLDRE